MNYEPLAGPCEVKVHQHKREKQETLSPLCCLGDSADCDSLACQIKRPEIFSKCSRIRILLTRCVGLMWWLSGLCPYIRIMFTVITVVMIKLCSFICNVLCILLEIFNLTNYCSFLHSIASNATLQILSGPQVCLKYILSLSLS